MNHTISRIKFWLTIYPSANSFEFYRENNTEHHKRCRPNTLYRLEVGMYGLKENNVVKSHFKQQDYLIRHSVSDGNYKSQIPHNP
jgi:hypothetical protein